ncbi:hypothetical protein GA0111570_101430 [Raineyella antarctica]|uniref:Cell division protein FtsL n=1 Tax=Raineyella antarctica TaxID=1577474 RepID=A0A1G6GEI0_9ACTN|nr:hypothetical protein [Raineyella antarctica]SDB80155.1 hypothetical protein GA0111570_101430 [Raineyella antarctica]
MSALTSPVLGVRGSLVEAAQRRRAQLRVVPVLTAQISQRAFWGVLIGVFIVGTTLLLMLNVTLQNQAFALRTLAAQEQVLTNQQAALEQQLTERSSSAQLAQRAIDLGMVPATEPGYIMLPDGTLLGDPKPVTGAGPYAGLRTPQTPAVQPSAAPTGVAAAQPSAAPSAAASTAPSAAASAQPSAAASAKPSTGAPASAAAAAPQASAATGTNAPNGSSQKG